MRSRRSGSLAPVPALPYVTTCKSPSTPGLNFLICYITQKGVEGERTASWATSRKCPAGVAPVGNRGGPPSGEEAALWNRGSAEHTEVSSQEAGSSYVPQGLQSPASVWHDEYHRNANCARPRPIPGKGGFSSGRGLLCALPPTHGAQGGLAAGRAGAPGCWRCRARRPRSGQCTGRPRRGPPCRMQGLFLRFS